MWCSSYDDLPLSLLGCTAHSSHQEHFKLTRRFAPRVAQLLQKKTPFFAPNELDVYAKICRHRAGTLANNMEAGTPLAGKGMPKCLAFLEKAIHPDPALRITGAQAKKDPWFSGEVRLEGECVNRLTSLAAHDTRSK